MRSGTLNSCPSRRLSLFLYLAATLVLLTVITLQQFSAPPVSPLATRLQAFPLQIGNWQGTEESVEQEIVSALQLDDWMLRLYRQSPDIFVWLYIGYYADRSSFAQHHSPQVCYPANGWRLIQNGFQHIRIPGSEPIVVQKLVVQKGLQRRLVLYWHQWGEEVMTEQGPLQRHWLQTVEEYKLRFAAILRRTGLRTGSALVRVSVPLVDSIQDALSHEIDFIQIAFPLLAQHFALEVASR